MANRRLRLLSPSRGSGLAPGACRFPGRHLRAGAGQGGLLRPGDPHVPPPPADRLDRLGGAAAAALLRSQPDRRTSSRRPGTPPRCLHNAHVKLAFWRAPTRMDHLARNGDGDQLIFVHEGAGDLFCDYGHLEFRAGDYIVVPRSTMWRLECATPVTRAADRGDRRLADAAGQGHRRAARDLRSGDARYAADRRRVPRPAGRGRDQGRDQAARRDQHRDLPVQPVRCGRLVGRSVGLRGSTCTTSGR